MRYSFREIAEVYPKDSRVHRGLFEGSGDGGKDGDLEGAGARSDPGSAGQHGCADLGGIWLTTRYRMR